MTPYHTGDRSTRYSPLALPHYFACRKVWFRLVCEQRRYSYLCRSRRGAPRVPQYLLFSPGTGRYLECGCCPRQPLHVFCFYCACYPACTTQHWNMAFPQIQDTPPGIYVGGGRHSRTPNYHILLLPRWPARRRVACRTYSGDGTFPRRPQMDGAYYAHLCGPGKFLRPRHLRIQLPAHPLREAH